MTGFPHATETSRWNQLNLSWQKHLVSKETLTMRCQLFLTSLLDLPDSPLWLPGGWALTDGGNVRLLPKRNNFIFASWSLMPVSLNEAANRACENRSCRSWCEMLIIILLWTGDKNKIPCRRKRSQSSLTPHQECAAASVFRDFLCCWHQDPSGLISQNAICAFLVTTNSHSLFCSF